jgi:hypothetical protein
MTIVKEHAAGTSYHILAASSRADERTRVLKHGDTFAVFDHYDDIMTRHTARTEAASMPCTALRKTGSI